ncbi:hypothetical protein [Saccharothrix deserti]|uniref:hypothetical protein n=1 Tax=Saccharothrix deserti TaxID=2593674 RepID=UPI00131CA4FD|nr:hypothetical protein [Saccharothrix deserti]
MFEGARVERDGDALVVRLDAPARALLRELADRLHPLLTGGEPVPRRGLVERRQYRKPEAVRTDLPPSGSRWHADVLDAVRRLARDLATEDDVRLDDPGLQRWLCALSHLKPLVVPKLGVRVHDDWWRRSNHVAATLCGYQNLLLSAAEPELYGMVARASC